MTDETDKMEAGYEPDTEQAETPSADDSGAGGISVEEAVEALVRENADLKDQTLRTLAEMENLRRRTEREVRDAKQYAVASFARDMLTVSDNLSRALEALPAETRESADEGLKALIDGIGMTEREMLNQLEKHGVRPINPEGEKFDPNFHQAMFEVPNADVPNGTVVQVVQTGYVIGERVLRPAMVGVAKGAPKPAPRPVSGDPGQTVDKTA
ncbi:nucleotide exchange factor GrpE [Breoghania sp. L-A4]|uniref:nucleotide exchange factor GrpE n=1 Tax=Breoghania sp. L-A4 TaxID=2304600 RepID=UPI000E35DE6F|nr:nucleotide exchange factor GrpE [Breoghania sp. L-A4]AXS39072.1 nucleotide exchange factor GrpE [Breoghania sp. L-A4]